jgi:hypothetical protein
VTLDQVVTAHYRRQTTLARRTADRAAQAWRRLDRGDIARSWLGLLLTEVLPTVASAQGIAAASSGAYVDDALEAQRSVTDVVGRVNPAMFANVASDGRDLVTLLQQPVITALTALRDGATVPRALTVGRLDLDMIVRTQVADAGRVADGVAITSRPRVAGYVRMLSPPSCGRCTVLAGRHYRWNAGFLRHPRCDCRHVPVAEDNDEDLRTDPRKAFDAMTEAEQAKAFTKAGAQAIRDGADMGRVVNARRGMYTAGGRQFTTEATTRRGTGRRVRLMPEQIYRESHGDRDEAVRLLRLHGFIH